MTDEKKELEEVTEEELEEVTEEVTEDQKDVENGSEDDLGASNEEEVEMPVLDEEDVVEVDNGLVEAPKDQEGKSFNKKLVLLAALGMLTVGGLVYTVVNREKEYTTEQVEKIKDTYYLEMTFEQLANKLNSSENMLVYFGRDDCEGCAVWNKKALPILEESNARVYYVETKKQGEKNPELKEKILGELNVSTVPQVLVFEKGQLVKTLDPEQDLKGSLKDLSEILGRDGK